MIILDPDLDPAPAPRSISAKRFSAPILLEEPLNLRLPSPRTLARFLAVAQAAVRLKGEVTILLTTDNAIQDLNRRFRRRNTATDVLSFPADSPMPGTSSERIAGDLAISVPTALCHAVEQRHSLSIEIKVLILHGLLHLAGYDHEGDTGQMARRERLLRARLRLPQGLIERTELERKVKLSTRELGAPSLRRLPVARMGNHKTNSGVASNSPTRLPSKRGTRP